MGGSLKLLRFLIGGAFTALFEQYFKRFNVHRALGALPHLPRPIRPAWERGSFGASLGRLASC